MFARTTSIAFAEGALVAALGGLIGLGGAEFRLPILVPMAAGSLLGAAAGGALVGVASGVALKVGLGVVLIGSALRVFRPPPTGASPHSRIVA